jgi:formylglycine-generating enzyme required for sulfatase activity
VYAIEMVYNQVGGFQAGSGGQNTGELRTATDVSATGTAATFTVTGTSPTLQGNSSSASPTNIAARANASSDLTGTNTASLAAGYPTGFNAFYAMKYEISQQQYVDFLNTLTYTQQAARTAATSPPNSAATTGALIHPNDKRNGIDIQTSGTASTVPAVYACNLNGNGSFNESDDGQHIACNFLSWDDLVAYLDWAALRPMTELEYEKSCRGNQNPATNEFAWGNTSATALSGLSNASTMTETASNTSSNIAYNNSFTSGPVRTGIFATSSTGRATSGSGYYGNMELSGNLWERVVTVGNSTGRTFSGVHGNGTLTSGGASDVAGWPTAAGTGWKGGSWLNTTTNSATTSDRAEANNANNTRAADAGGRGVRTISSGIVTDGLVLWLDAGTKPSYPGSGTTWIDLSGNNNNGTLVNGPTYSSTNGGVVVFDGVNDYVSVPINLSTSNYTIIAIARYTGSKNDRVISSNSGNWLLGWWASQTNKYYAEGWVSPASGGTAETSWICYAGVGNYISDSWELYRNGVSIVGPNNAGVQGPNGIRLGGSGFVDTESSACQVGLVLAYNRVLSAAEILQTFNALKSRFGL